MSVLRINLTKLFCCLSDRNSINLKYNLRNYHGLIKKMNNSDCKYLNRHVVMRNVYRSKELSAKNKSVVLYSVAGVIFVVGMSFAAVPLYRIYCQTTGKGGRPFLDAASEKIQKMNKVKDRLITVNFNADVTSTTAWNFKPTQDELKVLFQD